MTVSEKKINVPLHKKSSKPSKEMKLIKSNVSIITNTYNGKIVPEFAKYILIVSKDDWNNTLFIFESGA